MGWLFWDWDVPELVICSMAFDERLLVVGDGDVIGFGDGDLFVGEDSYAIVVTCLPNGEER